MKKLLFTLLALPMLSAAQEKPVQVPPCIQGNAFTIRIPVKFPENMTVQYAWYRNDTLVEDSHTLLMGEKAIAYTVPTDKAFGSAVYYFMYRLDDKHYEWTASPKYALTFEAWLEGDCSNGLSTGGSVNVSAVSCSNGLSTGGTVSVSTASCSNGLSTGGTVSVSTASCSNGLSTGGTVSVSTASCSNGLSTGGTVSVSTASCSNGLNTGGTISVVTN